MFIEGRCYETFPRLAILKKFQLSAYFPKSTSRIDNQRLCDWLMSCNEGLRGQIAPIDVKYFPAGHPRKGARVIIFSGNQDFLDSLQNFPKDFPFNINIGNVYVRGGTRTGESKRKSKRPNISPGSIEQIVLKSVNDIMRNQNLGDDDQLARKMNGTSINANAAAAPPPNNQATYPVCLLYTSDAADE